MAIQKITPFLWYSTQAEEAAAFYAGVFPDSRVARVTAVPGTGSTKLVEFVLFGQPFFAMSHPRTESFNHAISFLVSCRDQAELDRYWSALLEGGGSPDDCGWLRDRFGVSWQIVPDDLIAMMADPDPVKAARVAGAMMSMRKFDVAALRAAAVSRTARRRGAGVRGPVRSFGPSRAGGRGRVQRPRHAQRGVSVHAGCGRSRSRTCRMR